MRRTGLISSRTLAIIAVSVFALIGGGLLAWWQWTRYESASGTLQNLGYVLQWPLFGVFPGFMFWRIHKAAKAQAAEDALAGPPDIETIPEQPAPHPAERPDTNRTNQARDEELPSSVKVAAATDDWLSQLAYVQKRTADDRADVDPDLVAYNSYLATLSAREQRK